jgi:hypothetical protein
MFTIAIGSDEFGEDPLRLGEENALAFGRSE